LAPILYNLGIIIGIFTFVPLGGIIGLAFGVVLGALLHFLIMFLTANHLGFAPLDFILNLNPIYLKNAAIPSDLRSRLRRVKRIVALSFPRVLAISLTNLTLLVLIAIASTLAKGSIAVLQLAQNLYFLPIGIFGVSYAVAVFPRMNRAYIVRDGEEFFRELFFGIRSILFWIVPSMILFIVLRAHIVRVTLGAGAFSWEDTRLTAAVLAALSITMFAGALSTLLIKGFYALENTWKPFFINLSSSLFSLILAYGLVKVLTSGSVFAGTLASLFRISDLPRPEVIGLGLGFSAGLLLNILLLYFSLQRLAEKTFVESQTATETFGVKLPAKIQTSKDFPTASILKIVIAS
ncbi:MAG: lipid II flippase MurJ, partial [Candidatus Paceibacteria bacterium]